jgi:hypothetical protein
VGKGNVGRVDVTAGGAYEPVGHPGLTTPLRLLGPCHKFLVFQFCVEDFSADAGPHECGLKWSEVDDANATTKL